MSAPAEFARLLAVLRGHGVDFVLVGGVAAWIQGVPLATTDVDIVPSRDAENVTRLLAALAELDASSRLHPPGHVRPDRSHLSGRGHVLLTTRLGLLDVLGSVGRGDGYDELLPLSEPIVTGDGVEVRVASLETLIRLKEEAGRPKDVAALPVFRATLAERQRRES